MANQEHLERMLASVAESNECREWNQWRKHDWNQDHRVYQTAIDLSGARLNSTNLRGANLHSANLHNANLNGAILHEADLSEANLSRAAMRFTDLNHAYLHKTIMNEADSSGANLCRATLSEADLSGANLSHAHLDGAVLTLARLHATNLQSAHLRSALLQRADLSRADLSNALLFKADLREANLSETYLSLADLRGAQLHDANLRQFSGLPTWPAITEEDRAQVQQEASDPATQPDRLTWLAWHWSGWLMQEQITANPNTPPETLIALAQDYPIAFLANPVLPLLFLDQPHWLPAHAAQVFVNTISQHPLFTTLKQQYSPLFRLIEKCATHP